MWSSIIESLVSTTDENSIPAILRIRLVRVIAAASLIALGIGFVLQGAASGGLQLNSPLVVLMAVNVVVLFMAWIRYIALASTLLVILMVVAMFAAPGMFLLFGTLAVIASSALMELPLHIVASLVVAVNYVQQLQQVWTVEEGVISGPTLTWLVTGVALAAVSAISRYATGSIRRTAQVADRNARLLGATARIGELTSSILKRQEMFERSVDFIKNELGYYHVQVFLVRDNTAELVASTGGVGQKLLEEKHRLAVGSNSVIGQATQYGRPILVRDTSSDPTHRFNPLLPFTRSELGVPILDGEDVIGAVDLQSATADDFQDQDIQALQTISNLLGAALRNARLFEQQERTVEEQQRLYLESEANLREIRRLNRQLTRIGWEEYVTQSARTTGVTLRDDELIPNSDWTQNLIAASTSGQPIIQTANGKPGVLAVPVRLRGEIIGAIEVETGDDMPQQEALEMVEAVAQRLATSLDNARLFEEAQAATVQEQRVNTIVARYQSAASVDDLLQVTLKELGEALGAQRGAIRLGIIADEHVNGGAAQ